MRSSSFVRSIPTTLALAASAMLVACGGGGDLGADRLADVKSGDSRDALLTTLGNGPLAATGSDTLRLANGYRRQRYFVNGVTYEVIWFRAEPGSLQDDIVRERETPILLAADTVMGWGWSFFDTKARELDLPNPMREKARLDSIANAQQGGGA